MLQKRVYAYEYVDDWEKFIETSSPKNKYFYSCLNMENITDTDYRHMNKF